ncbi:unnamed protein product [Oncorhynchus mykiss]|uniref:Uncharacterized protein n=1 Tax=Oncorhynchus mykiss TaxID=8022 RepID=A0A060Y8H3_ONCMY|nr:unnamed protein product [Oncorhynchus mykiss]
MKRTEAAHDWSSLSTSSIRSGSSSGSGSASLPESQSNHSGQSDSGVDTASCHGRSQSVVSSIFSEAWKRGTQMEENTRVMKIATEAYKWHPNEYMAAVKNGQLLSARAYHGFWCMFSIEATSKSRLPFARSSKNNSSIKTVHCAPANLPSMCKWLKPLSHQRKHQSDAWPRSYKVNKTKCGLAPKTTTNAPFEIILSGCITAWRLHHLMSQEGLKDHQVSITRRLPPCYSTLHLRGCCPMHIDMASLVTFTGTLVTSIMFTYCILVNMPSYSTIAVYIYNILSYVLYKYTKYSIHILSIMSIHLITYIFILRTLTLLTTSHTWATHTQTGERCFARSDDLSEIGESFCLRSSRSNKLSIIKYFIWTGGGTSPALPLLLHLPLPSLAHPPPPPLPPGNLCSPLKRSPSGSSTPFTGSSGWGGRKPPPATPQKASSIKSNSSAEYQESRRNLLSKFAPHSPSKDPSSSPAGPPAPPKPGKLNLANLALQAKVGQVGQQRQSTADFPSLPAECAVAYFPPPPLPSDGHVGAPKVAVVNPQPKVPPAPPGPPPPATINSSWGKGSLKKAPPPMLQRNQPSPPPKLPLPTSPPKGNGNNGAPQPGNFMDDLNRTLKRKSVSRQGSLSSSRLSGPKLEPAAGTMDDMELALPPPPPELLSGGNISGYATLRRGPPPAPPKRGGNTKLTH